jgi:hypothetical protein
MKFKDVRIMTALLTALLSTSAAADPLTSNFTKAQLDAITMTTIARVAGSNHRCPGFHLVEPAVFQNMHDADIPQAMLDTQEFKNAQALILVNTINRMKANPSDFCLTAWQLFGPQALYGRQMLEEN